MASYLEHLAALKVKMTAESEISKVFSYFFDHLADHVEFIAACEPERHPLVEALLPPALESVLGKGAKPRDLLLTRYAKLHTFYHGGFMVSGCLGSVIYFDDLRTGCIAVARSMSGLTEYIRFSARDPADPAITGRN